jgi:hypothetical protein
MFALVLLQFSIFAGNTLLDKKFYLSKYESAGIYKYIEESIDKSLKSIGRTVNLPEELFLSLASKAWIREQVDYTTSETLDYMVYKTEKLPVIDTAKQIETFNKSFDDYVKKLNLTMEKNALNEINNIKKEVADVVKSQASFVDFASISKSSAFQKGRKALYYSSKAKSFIIAALLINIILLWLVNFKNFTSFIRWTGYSLIAGGLMTFIPSAIALLSGFSASISMAEAVLKALIVSIIEASLKYFIASGAIILAMGVVVILASILIDNRKISKFLSN